MLQFVLNCSSGMIRILGHGSQFCEGPSYKWPWVSNLNSNEKTCLANHGELQCLNMDGHHPKGGTDFDNEKCKALSSSDKVVYLSLLTWWWMPREWHPVMAVWGTNKWHCIQTSAQKDTHNHFKVHNNVTRTHINTQNVLQLSSYCHCYQTLKIR